jgi:predicted O-methyltransferase YrrM
MKEIAALAEAVLENDPRPKDMRDWQADPTQSKCIGARAYYRFLYEYARRFRPRIMVELGTDCGYGAWHLARGNPDGTVIAVDLTFERLNIPPGKPLPIILVEGDSLESCQRVVEAAAHAPIDMILFDTADDHEHVGRELAAYRELCMPGTLMMFDDIGHRKMTPLWDKIPEPKLRMDRLHPAWRRGAAPGFALSVLP